MRRDDDAAVGVADDHVARPYRRVAAGDRHVGVDRLMQGQVGRRGRALVERRDREPRDLGRVAKAAVGDDAGDAALHQARHQDRAGRRGRVNSKRYM